MFSKPRAETAAEGSAGRTQTSFLWFSGSSVDITVYVERNDYFHVPAKHETPQVHFPKHWLESDLRDPLCCALEFILRDGNALDWCRESPALAARGGCVTVLMVTLALLMESVSQLPLWPTFDKPTAGLKGSLTLSGLGKTLGLKS